MPNLFPKRRTLALAGAAFLLAASAGGVASAHHSYAMFDHDKTISLAGTVYTWEMINPHSYLWVLVPKQGGGPEQNWGLEGGGVAALSRTGVTKSMVKPGEKVVVSLHPLRDGRTGGQLLSVTLADGRVIRMGGGGGGPAEAKPPE